MTFIKNTCSYKWLLNNLSLNLTSKIYYRIFTQPINLSPVPMPDIEIWNLNGEGIFTTKSAYFALLNQITKLQPTKTILQSNKIYPGYGPSPVTHGKFFSFGKHFKKASQLNCHCSKLNVYPITFVLSVTLTLKHIATPSETAPI